MTGMNIIIVLPSIWDIYIWPWLCFFHEFKSEISEGVPYMTIIFAIAEEYFLYIVIEYTVWAYLWCIDKIINISRLWVDKEGGGR